MIATATTAIRSFKQNFFTQKTALKAFKGFTLAAAIAATLGNFALAITTAHYMHTWIAAILSTNGFGADALAMMAISFMANIGIGFTFANLFNLILTHISLPILKKLGAEIDGEAPAAAIS